MVETDVGGKLAQLRRENGWSQKELAIAAGVSTRTVQRLEAEDGGTATCATIAILADWWMRDGAATQAGINLSIVGAPVAWATDSIEP